MRSVIGCIEVDCRELIESDVEIVNKFQMVFISNLFQLCVHLLKRIPGIICTSVRVGRTVNGESRNGTANHYHDIRIIRQQSFDAVP